MSAATSLPPPYTLLTPSHHHHHHRRPSTLRPLHHPLLHHHPFPHLTTLSHSHIFTSHYSTHNNNNTTTTKNNNIFSNAYLTPQPPPPSSHPWPEWQLLLETIPPSISGGFDVGLSVKKIKDEFVSNESLSMEFVDAASLFLGFADNNTSCDILSCLPKDDIQVLVDNGTPFLFKNATETEKRIRSFLKGDETSEATTLDLMKYILSYASNPIFYPERIIKEAAELCARNLLREMASLNTRGDDDHTTRNLGPNDSIRTGDWICQKCSFKNVAKNTICLECEKLRPRRQLTGNEWDCPKCNFFNNGRNTVCLKCECSRPGEVSLPVRQVKSSGYAPFVPLPDDMFANKPEYIKTGNLEPKSNVSETNLEKSVTKIVNQIRDIAEDEKSEKQFKKVAELHDVADSTSVNSDDDFPEMMPMRKGENRFVVSKKKDRSLNSPTYKQQQAIEQEKNSNFVPFVPFPPDYFAKKDNSQPSISSNSSLPLHENLNKAANDMKSVEETRNVQMKISENRPETLNGEHVEPKIPPVKETEPLDVFKEAKAMISSNQKTHENSFKSANDTNLVEETRNTRANRSENRPEALNRDQVKQNGFQRPSLEGSAVKETDPLDMSEEAKAERWFKRVAQIKDISELSQIPDEDFPSLMPMRKGVNRFVVSKRKTPLERRLSSPEYQRNLRTVRPEPSKKDGDSR